MARIGYAPISSVGQSLAVQRDKLSGDGTSITPAVGQP